MRANMRMYYNMTTEDERKAGAEWYVHYHRWITLWAEHFGIDPLTFAQVVAALSPNNKWERNLQDALNLTEAVVIDNKRFTDLPKVCTYTSNKAKAVDILRGTPVTWGPKTEAFTRNLGLLDTNYVTIDIWHWRLVTDGMRKPPRVLTEARYREITELTKDEASKVGLVGFEYQAILWGAIRKHLH